MPKANVVLADGTKVTIEGTSEEIATVLSRISTTGSQAPVPKVRKGVERRRRRAAGKDAPAAASGKTRSKGPADYIRELASEGFFKTKRGLRDVQEKLEEGAHIYPVTHLSPVLFRLVHLKELRRIKEDGTWKYVNP
jgi:hypothetical protein